MSEATVVNGFRNRIAVHLDNGTALLPIGYMAFGDGGHNEDLTPNTPAQSATALNHEVLRKPIGSITHPDDYSVTGTCTINRDELVGVQLSEAGLLDTAGNLIALKFFAPKVKEDDERYDISLTMRL